MYHVQLSFSISETVKDEQTIMSKLRKLLDYNYIHFFP